MHMDEEKKPSANKKPDPEGTRGEFEKMEKLLEETPDKAVEFAPVKKGVGPPPQKKESGIPKQEDILLKSQKDTIKAFQGTAVRDPLFAARILEEEKKKEVKPDSVVKQESALAEKKLASSAGGHVHIYGAA